MSLATFQFVSCLLAASNR